MLFFLFTSNIFAKDVYLSCESPAQVKLSFVINDEKKLDVYEDYPILYKKYYFLYEGKKVMTYTMTKKTPFRFPTERYLNVIKHGYKDCKLNIKYLEKALIE